MGYRPFRNDHVWSWSRLKSFCFVRHLFKLLCLAIDWNQIAFGAKQAARSVKNTCNCYLILLRSIKKNSRRTKSGLRGTKWSFFRWRGVCGECHLGIWFCQFSFQKICKTNNNVSLLKTPPKTRQIFVQKTKKLEAWQRSTLSITTFTIDS